MGVGLDLGLGLRWGQGLGLRLLLVCSVLGDGLVQSPKEIALFENFVSFLDDAVSDKINVSGLICGQVLDFHKSIFQRDDSPVT